MGGIINFYNVLFYNQNYNRYDTYSDLFVKSTLPNLETSVSEIIFRGIAKEKLIIGKPATLEDCLTGQGYVNPVDLGVWA